MTTQSPSVLICILGEVYISNLISMLTLQSKLAEIGIKLEPKFYEHDIPPLTEIIQLHSSQTYTGIVLCGGNVGFETAAVLEGLIEPVYATVPVEMDLSGETTDIITHTVGFIAMPKESMTQQETENEIFLDNVKRSKCLDDVYVFQSLIEVEFRGDLAQRNVLKIRG